MTLLGVLAAALLAACASAYQPGSLSPTVLSYVNFGLNPFINDCSDPNGYCPLPGYDGASIVGNQVTAQTDAPGLFMSNAAYPVPGLGSEIEVSGSMAFQAEHLAGPIFSPLGIDTDPLYGTGQLGFFDPASGWLFAHLMTNLRIYALYARLPNAQTPMNDYVAFSYLVPIAERSLYASNELSIVLNKAHYAVSWRIQGVERLFIERIGTPIDERFLLSEEGGSVRCLGFPDSVHTIFGFGMLPDAGNPYTACQSKDIFDQCNETIMEAEGVCCDYQPYQLPSTYSIGLMLTVEHFAVLQWRPSLDCHNTCAMNVACIRPEPLCFGGCPVMPVPLPPNTGCGRPVLPRCECSTDSENTINGIPCGCPQIYRECPPSACCQGDCPVIYREIQLQPCPARRRSSSSSSCKPCRFRNRPIQRRKSSSSSSLERKPCRKPVRRNKSSSSELPARRRLARRRESSAVVTRQPQRRQLQRQSSSAQVIPRWMAPGGQGKPRRQQRRSPYGKVQA